ncbi:MAG: VIT domain-containing protein [Bacteroidales bacterium]
MKKKLLALMVLASTISYTFAQDIIFPRITSNISKNETEIQIKKLKVDVFVLENIATTTLEMEFYNANNRVMEGELNFPLANGVTVSRFALDVNGEMREGAVVEKEKATQAFESVIRRNIDPGLVEVTKGNNFKARVYPIPAKGYKKALIAFEQELKGDEKYVYQLPVNFKHELEKFSVKVEVVMNKPEVVKSSHPAINLEFTNVRNSYISELNQSNVKLDSRIAFAMPKPDKISTVQTYKGLISNDNYFYINLSPKAGTSAKKKPSSISLVWDESGSGDKRNIDKELALLKSYLAWVGNCKVELIRFSNVLHSQKAYSVRGGKSDELIEELQTIQYDGATNFAALDFNSISSDEILLFSEGISNFGELECKDLSSSSIIAINSSGTANHTLLEAYATKTGGVYVDASTLSADAAEKLMTVVPKVFIGAEYSHDNIKDFYPAKGTIVAGNFSCAGIAEGAKNNIKLHFGYGNEVTDTYEITVDNSQRLENGVGERMWAQKKLKALQIADNRDEILEHCKKYRLVSSETSLIVLDDVSDYVRYKITPPQSLLAEYNRLVSLQNKSRHDSRESRIERLCKVFKDDIAWWESEHKKPIKKEKSADAQILDDDGIGERIAVREMLDNRGEAALQMEEAEELSEVEADKKTSRSKSNSSTIEIKAWESDADYMSEFKATDKENLYNKYLELKPKYKESPSFYFDVSSYLFQKGEKRAGLRVLSNLAELEMESPELLRTLGRKLSEYGFYSEALYIFKEIMKTRSFEPHSYIDLGMTYAYLGEYQKAIDNLYTIIDKEWDLDIISRFNGIELIVLHDINNIINKHPKGLDISKINDCFIKHMPVDIRVVVDWDADNTDIDLWTTDPNNERCGYSRNRTLIGGKISNDMTQGYGPEEFRLKKAPMGKYKIEVNFYGTRRQALLENVTVRALVYTHFGSSNEQFRVMTLQLSPSNSGMFDVGTLEFKD